MNFVDLQNKEVTLANGAVLCFSEAARQFNELRAFFEGEHESTTLSLMRSLRDYCFGRAIHPSTAACLRNEGFLQADGSIDHHLKQVVLASIRGTDDIYLDDPFTNAWEKAIAGLLYAHERIAFELPPSEREQFVQDIITSSTRIPEQPLQQSLTEAVTVNCLGRVPCLELIFPESNS